MKAFVQKAGGKSGEFVLLSPEECNRTHKTQLGAADWVMIGLLLLLVIGTGAIVRMVWAG